MRGTRAKQEGLMETLEPGKDLRRGAGIPELALKGLMAVSHVAKAVGRREAGKGSVPRDRPLLLEANWGWWEVTNKGS